MATPPERHDATCAGHAVEGPSQDARPGAQHLGTTASDDGDRDSEDDRTQETEAAGSTLTTPPPTSSPPYWLVQHTDNATGASESTLESRGIIMRDNESEDWGGRNSACWARSVEIPDYVVVNGSTTNIGAFVVFNVRVETINVGDGSLRTPARHVLASHEHPLTWGTRV